jgi:hypothetical protein
MDRNAKSPPHKRGQIKRLRELHSETEEKAHKKTKKTKKKTRKLKYLDISAEDEDGDSTGEDEEKDDKGGAECESEPAPEVSEKQNLEQNQELESEERSSEYVAEAEEAEKIIEEIKMRVRQTENIRKPSHETGPAPDQSIIDNFFRQQNRPSPALIPDDEEESYSVLEEPTERKHEEKEFDYKALNLYEVWKKDQLNFSNTIFSKNCLISKLSEGKFLSRPDLESAGEETDPFIKFLESSNKALLFATSCRAYREWTFAIAHRSYLDRIAKLILSDFRDVYEATNPPLEDGVEDSDAALISWRDKYCDTFKLTLADFRKRVRDLAKVVVKRFPITVPELANLTEFYCEIEKVDWESLRGIDEEKTKVLQKRLATVLKSGLGSLRQFPSSSATSWKPFSKPSSSAVSDALLKLSRPESHHDLGSLCNLDFEKLLYWWLHVHIPARFLQSVGHIVIFDSEILETSPMDRLCANMKPGTFNVICFYDPWYFASVPKEVATRLWLHKSDRDGFWNTRWIDWGEPPEETTISAASGTDKPIDILSLVSRILFAPNSVPPQKCFASYLEQRKHKFGAKWYEYLQEILVCQQTGILVSPDLNLVRYALVRYRKQLRQIREGIRKSGQERKGFVVDPPVELLFPLEIGHRPHGLSRIPWESMSVMHLRESDESKTKGKRNINETAVGSLFDTVSALGSEIVDQKTSREQAVQILSQTIGPSRDREMDDKETTEWHQEEDVKDQKDQKTEEKGKSKAIERWAQHRKLEIAKKSLAEKTAKGLHQWIHPYSKIPDLIFPAIISPESHYINAQSMGMFVRDTLHGHPSEIIANARIRIVKSGHIRRQWEHNPLSVNVKKEPWMKEILERIEEINNFKNDVLSEICISEGMTYFLTTEVTVTPQITLKKGTRVMFLYEEERNPIVLDYYEKTFQLEGIGGHSFRQELSTQRAHVTGYVRPSHLISSGDLTFEHWEKCKEKFGQDLTNELKYKFRFEKSQSDRTQDLPKFEWTPRFLTFLKNQRKTNLMFRTASGLIFALRRVPHYYYIGKDIGTVRVSQYPLIPGPAFNSLHTPRGLLLECASVDTESSDNPCKSSGMHFILYAMEHVDDTQKLEFSRKGVIPVLRLASGELATKKSIPIKSLLKSFEQVAKHARRFISKDI